MKHTLTLICLVTMINLNTAQELPFKSIEKTEKVFSTGNLVARMVEGLGFRYYWASEGLRAEDLKFSPVKDGRSALQTITHIHGLSVFLLSALEKKTFSPESTDGMSFENVRKATLLNFKKAVDILKSSKDEDFEDYNIRFANGGEFPFWNAINGPISDAIYHTGQVVMMRRMSGNPINPNVSVLAGKLR